MTSRSEVLEALGETLRERGYRSITAVDVGACWVRRTFNTNRAVVLLDVPDNVDDPAPWAREQRLRCARAVGFRIPLFFHPGVQIVTLGPSAVTEPSAAVDRYDNQWCVIQAIHVVDLERPDVTSGATWGQVVSGSDQEAVAHRLQQVVGGAELADVLPVERSAQPRWVGLALAGGAVAIAINILMAFLG